MPSASQLAELRSLSQCLLQENGNSADRILEIDRFRHILDELSELDLLPGGVNAMHEGRQELAHGIAISPIQAAFCAREPLRSIAFMRASLAALQACPNPVSGPKRILYAGCGPYALLVLPILLTHSADQVQVDLLDVSASSLEYAMQLLTGLGLSDHVGLHLCEDATRYTIPSERKPDLIISETMNVALSKEPQFAIMRHLCQQAPSALTVPQAVHIDLGLGHSRELRELGRVFSLDHATLLSTDPEAMRVAGNSLSLEKISTNDQAYYLLTRIQVFGPHWLRDHESSLNLPQRLRPAPGVGEFRFHYALGAAPHIAYIAHAAIAEQDAVTTEVQPG